MALIAKFRSGELKNNDFDYKNIGVIRLRDGKIVCEDDDGKLASIVDDYSMNENGDKLTKADGLAFLRSLPFQYSGVYFNAQLEDDDEDPDPLELEEESEDEDDFEDENE